MNRDRGDKTKHSDDIGDTDNVRNIFRLRIITISLLRQDDRQLTQSGEWSDHHTHTQERVHAHWPVVDRAFTAWLGCGWALTLVIPLV